jgi:glycosyltransferase involved in cell wall biosynthesis
VAPPRVCILTSQYPPDTGGVGHSAQRVAGLLAGQGLEMHVLHLRKHAGALPLDEAIESRVEGRVVVHRARVWHPEWREPGCGRSEAEVLTRYNRETFEVASRLQREHGFDLLHGFFLYPAGFVATATARSFGVPSVVSIRGNDVGKYAFDPLRQGFVSACLRGADRVTSVATSLLELADRLLHPIAGKARVILNSIDAAAIRPGARPELPLGGTVIGTAGLMRYKKGLVYLFKALAALAGRHELTLLLAGDFFDSRERDLHLEMLRELGLLPRTLLTGRLSREQMLDHLQLFDAVAFPSLFAEGCPLSMLEAMAVGRAIVASRAGAMPELIRDGESGLLVPPGSARGLEGALGRLIEAPGLRAQLGEGARRRARELTPESELEAWLETYGELLDGLRQRASGARGARAGAGPDLCGRATA